MTGHSNGMLGLGILLVVFALGAVVFRDTLGLVVFLVLGVAVVVQIIRVAWGNGNGKTLGRIWGAFKDAFWGIG